MPGCSFSCLSLRKQKVLPEGENATHLPSSRKPKKILSMRLSSNQIKQYLVESSLTPSFNLSKTRGLPGKRRVFIEKKIF